MEGRAKLLVAANLIVDLISVADRPPVRGAKIPNRELDPSRKAGREGRIELARVDCAGKPLDHPCAAVRPVAATSVIMVCPETKKNAGSVQESVHQAVDGDEARADFDPR